MTLRSNALRLATREGAAVAILVVLAVAQAVFMRLEHSLSIDEPVMVMRSRLPLGTIIEALTKDNAAPLPQLIQYIWIRLFGESELALRAFSALCFGAAVAVVMRWAERMADRRAGLLAGVLAATSFLGIEHAATARPYALLNLIVAGAGLRMWTSRVSAGSASGGHARFLDPALVMLHLAGLLTHPIYVFPAVVLAAAAALFSRPDAQRSIISLAVAAALYLVLWGPVLWATLSLPTTAWMRRPRLVDLAAGVAELWGVTGGLVLTVCALAGMVNARLSLWESKRAVAASVGLAIAPLLLAYVVSAWRPVYVAERTPAIILAPASVLLGVALAGLRSPLLTTTIVVGLVVSAARFTLAAASGDDPFPVRAAARQLAAEARCEDVIVIIGLSGPELDYYLRQANAPACLRRVVLPAELTAHPGWIHPDTLRFGTRIAADAEEAVDFLVAEGVQRLWVIAPLTSFGRQLTPFAQLAIERQYVRQRKIAGSGSFFDAIVEYTRQTSR
jgi:mannosyltransferase